MEHTNIIYTKRKILFINNNECHRKYYCVRKFTIPICKCFNVNSSTPNKHLIISSPNIPIKLQEHININFNKYTHLYWNSSTMIIVDIPLNIIYIQYKGQLNIINYLPSNLQHLSLGGEFNHPVNNLPSTLKFLRFGKYFNQPVNNLPFGLEKIWFGHYFIQQLDYLPETLIYIELSSHYSNDIMNLPIGIQQILLDKSYEFEYNKFDTIKLLENKIVWK